LIPALKLPGPTKAAPECAPQPTPKPAANEGGKFEKNLIYLRREKAIPKSVHIQEPNLQPLHEVTISNPIIFYNSNEFSEAQVDQNLDLPIALVESGPKHAANKPNNHFTLYQISCPLKNSPLHNLSHKPKLYNHTFLCI